MAGIPKKGGIEGPREAERYITTTSIKPSYNVSRRVNWRTPSEQHVKNINRRILNICGQSHILPFFILFNKFNSEDKLESILLRESVLFRII